MRCPGSINALAGIDSDAEHSVGVEAAIGTALHEITEQALMIGPQIVDGYIGSSWTIDDHEFALDAEQIQAVKDILETVEDMDGYEIGIEQWVDLSYYIGEGNGGTCDLWAANRETKHLIVKDWKYGSGVPVQAEDNEQLQLYGLGAVILLDLPAEWTVDLCIEQPRHPAGGGQVRTTVLALKQFAQKAKAAAEATLDPEAPRIAGDKQCQWCPVKGTCAERAAWFERKMEMLWDQVPSTSVEDLSPEKRAWIVLNAGSIRKWLDAVHAAAMADGIAGRPIPGLKVAYGKSPARSWQKDLRAQAEKVIVRLLGKKQAFTQPTLLSPTQVEKLLDPEVYEKRVEQFVNTGTRSLVLVAEDSDKKEAVTFKDC